MAWSKRERVLATLRGEVADRTPVAAWGHLIPAEIDTRRLAEESLRFFNDYDWDWLKVNPRASHFAEAWGSEFDFRDYHGVLPRFVRNRFDPFDPAKLERVSVSNPIWSDHLELLKRIKKGIGGAPFVQTIFSPASVLAYLAGRPTDHSQAGAAKNHIDTLLHLIRTQPKETHHALSVIAESLAELAEASVDAGAAGVFFAIVKLARKGAMTPAEFEEFGKPYDFLVLQKVKGAGFNVLHACGTDTYWERFQDYPVSTVNWASIGQGNPDLGSARTGSPFSLMGGIDELGALQTGTPEQVFLAATAALKLGGLRKFLLAPGCAVEPSVPAANLKALRSAVDKQQF